MVEEGRRKEEDLMIISSVEEYAVRHNMKECDVIDLFMENGIPELLRSNHDSLHTVDLSESCDFVEDYIENTKR